jgi:hypothetical protein
MIIGAALGTIIATIITAHIRKFSPKSAALQRCGIGIAICIGDMPLTIPVLIGIRISQAHAIAVMMPNSSQITIRSRISSCATRSSPDALDVIPAVKPIRRVSWPTG